MIRAERNARVMAEANAAVVKAEAANAQADLSSSEALNALLQTGVGVNVEALPGMPDETDHRAQSRDRGERAIASDSDSRKKLGP